MKARMRLRRLLIGASLLGACLALCGCESANTVMATGASFAADLGVISQGQAKAVSKVGESFKDITPEQEYYLGRAVGATLVTRYKPWRRDAAEQYLNVLGQTLAQFSDLPQTFGGYHFLVLDSDEINAFAAPGGLIFVTRGMLRCCPDEASVAAVLAHEIGHVQYKHGLQAIKKGRLTSAFAVLGTESVKGYGAGDLATLVGAFEGSIQDNVTTLVNNGYSRAFESEADTAAVTILRRSGYNPAALITMLDEMKTRLTPGSSGFGMTHPSPDSRIDEIRSLLSANDVPPPKAKLAAAREQRLARALGGV
jgi:predicted Zn-dependent protease